MIRLSESVALALVDVGVKCVEDLTDVYNDVEGGEIRETVKKACSKIEYKRFLEARQYTNKPPVAAKADSVPASVNFLNAPPPPISSINAYQSYLHPVPTAVAMPLPLPPSIIVRKIDDCDVLKARNAATQAEIDRLDHQINQVLGISATLTQEKANKEQILCVSRKRQKEIQDLFNSTIKFAASVDLVFTVDCTGSMRSILKSILDQIATTATEIKALHSQITIRFAFVGYRDHCDGTNRLVLFNFNTDIEEFKIFLTGVGAFGGCGDWADVFGGVDTAANLAWSSQTRILYHVGDVPCHGTEYNGANGDPYRLGDPKGLKAIDILTKLKTQNVLYFFGRINTSTDKMITKFNELMQGPFITQQDINATTFMTTVTDTVSRTVSETVSSSFRTGGDKKDKKVIVIDTSSVVFTALSVEKASRFRLKLPGSMNDLINAFEDTDIIENWPASQPLRFKVALQPFACGATKAAYAAQQLGACSTTAVVLKESLYSSASELTKPKYEAFVACQRAAIYLAKEFHRCKPADTPTISFCDCSVVQFMDRRNQPFFIVEDKIPGNWEKYNNNNGFCAPNPTLDHATNHEIVQTFSHWTYHISQRKLMVVDCQGCFDHSSNTFFLTDPALHATNVVRFGGTNGGKYGMIAFFANHRCNEYCTAMGLSRPTVD